MSYGDIEEVTEGPRRELGDKLEVPKRLIVPAIGVDCCCIGSELIEFRLIHCFRPERVERSLQGKN